MSRRRSYLLLVAALALCAIVLGGCTRARVEPQVEVQVRNGIDEGEGTGFYAKPALVTGWVTMSQGRDFRKRFDVDTRDGTLPLEAVGFVGPLEDGDEVHAVVSDHGVNGVFPAYAVVVDVPFPYRTIRDRLTRTGLDLRFAPRFAGTSWGGEVAAFRLAEDDDRPRVLAMRIPSTRGRNKWLAQWSRAETNVAGEASYLYAFDDDDYLIVYFSDERNPSLNARTLQSLERRYGGPKRFDWSRLPVSTP